MAKNKDPAVLFYTSDFLSGTMLMTYEQKGKYITLLCLQRESGHLTEEEMLQICGTKDTKIWAKFVTDDEGKYFNERMEREVERRAAFTESRRRSSQARFTKTTPNAAHDRESGVSYDTSHDTSYDERTIHRVGNENINKNIDKSIDKDTKAIKHKYGLYSNVLLSDEDVTKLQAEFPIDWTDRIERLSEYIASSGKTYKSHLATIRSWAKTEADKPRHDEPKKRYGNFDPNEAFEAALRRSEQLDD